LFGAKPAENKSTSSLFLSKPAQTSTAEKPANTFSFGAKSTESGAKPASTFSFGAKPDVKNDDKPAGSLFGSKPAESSDKPATGLFGSKPEEKKDGNPTGSLFGSKPEEKKEDKPAATGGLFGSKPATSGSGFSFGAKPTETKDTTKPFSIGGSSGTTGGLFGSKSETATASSTTGGFSLGAKKDEEKKEDKPTGGFSFGTKKEDKKDEKPTSGFSFGAKKDEDKKDDKPRSGFSFGAKKDDKPAGGFSFGANKDDEKKDDQKTGGFSFGAKKDEEKKDNKPAGGFSFGAKKDDEKKDDKTGNTLGSTIAPSSTTNTAAPTLKPTKIEPIAVSIDNKTIDDLINKWSKQLTSTSKIFENYTGKVKQWDNKLISSGDEIIALNQDTIEAEATQSKIDEQLLFVEKQQDELEKILDNYEQQADVLLNNIELNSQENNGDNNTNINTISVTDKLRERAYHNAELLDERLDDLGENLTTLINEINSVSDVFNKSLIKEFGNQSNESKDDNPIEEIVQLLNLHLANLKYIENNEQKLTNKLSTIAK
jgi:nuclear pore complex protein Nup62